MELKNLPTTGYTPTIDVELSPLIDPELQAIILGRSKSAHEQFKTSGTLEIGAVCEKQSEGVSFLGSRVLMDAQFPHVMFICGKRGSGKSYTLGVVAEELARCSSDIGTVIVDPIGIFWSMKSANRSDKEREKLALWGMEAKGFDNVQVLTPVGYYNQLRELMDGPFSIATRDLTADDWCLVFDINRFKAQGLLIGDAIEKIKRGYTALVDGTPLDVPPLKDGYNIGDIIQCMEHDINLTSKEEGYAPATRRSVIARFRAAASWGLFTKEGTPLSEISKPNRVTILDISNPKLGDARRSLVVGILARKILEARIDTVRREEGLGRRAKVSSDTPWIPVTWLLIDEAHVLLPHSGRTAATDALIEYAKIGRKPGCALVLATQRPAATNDDILSQVDFLIGHNLALEEDMKALRKRVPAMMPKAFTSSDFLRGLPVGIGVVADQKTQKRAMLLQIRPRLSYHAGKAAVPTAMEEAGPEDEASMEEGLKSVEPLVEENILEPTVLVEHLVVPKVEEVPEAPKEDEAKPEKKRPKKGKRPQKETPPPVEKTEEAPVSFEPGGEIPDTGFQELEGKTWGTCVLVKGGRADDIAYEIFRSLMDSDLRALSISRKHPDKVRMSYQLGDFTPHWLSKTSDPLSVTPTNLGKVAHAINTFLKTSSRGVVVLEGLEYLVNNNDFTKVLRLIEDLHEKTIKYGCLMIIPVNPAVYSKRDVEMLQEEVDIVLGSDITSKKVKAEEEELKESEERLKQEREALEHEKQELYMEQERRLKEQRERLHQEEMEKFDNLRERAEQDRLDMVEKDRLTLEKEKQKILEDTRKKVEKELARIEKARIKFEEDQVKAEQRRRKQEERRAELEAKKREAEHQREKLKAEKTEKRLKEEEQRRLYELEAQRKRFEDEAHRLAVEREEMEDERQRLEEEQAERETELQRAKERRAQMRPPSVEELVEAPKKAAPKRKKKSTGRQVIEPRVSEKEVETIADRLLDRTLLGKKIEHIESISILFLPLLQMETRTIGGVLFSSERVGELLWDMVTGEMVTDFKSGLRRSKGLGILFELNDSEARVLCALKTRSLQDATDLIDRTELSSQSVKRALKSLKQKTLIAPGTRSDTKQEVYSRNLEISYPKKIDARPISLPGISILEVDDEILEERFKSKQVAKVISVLSPKTRVMREDVILYPFFFVEVSGKKGEKTLFIDAVTGKEDKVLTESITF